VTLYGVELSLGADAEEVASIVADELVAAARAGLSIVLTGGESPGRAYELAAEREPDWSAASLWWGDERCVPPQDERSNFRLARETLISRLQGAPREVQRIHGELGAERAAREYDDLLRGVSLDFVLLGLGPDGHAASLFPGQPTLDERDRRAIGGSVWAGITHVARSPYLLGISGFLFLYTVGSTVVYFAQTEIVGAAFATREARTEMLARMELATQVLTGAMQAFLTGRIIRAVGLSVALAVMPAVSVVGFAALGAAAWGMPALTVFVLLSVCRRATNFGLTNPAMEVLFTVVSREDKYKAKTFMETFVYRAGDQLAAWGYAGLAALGLGLSPIAWLTVPLSALFLALGLWLGAEHRARACEAPAPPPLDARGTCP
jgi:hypothetical protein